MECSHWPTPTQTPIKKMGSIVVCRTVQTGRNRHRHRCEWVSNPFCRCRCRPLGVFTRWVPYEYTDGLPLSIYRRVPFGFLQMGSVWVLRWVQFEYLQMGSVWVLTDGFSLSTYRWVQFEYLQMGSPSSGWLMHKTRKLSSFLLKNVSSNNTCTFKRKRKTVCFTSETFTNLKLQKSIPVRYQPRTCRLYGLHNESVWLCLGAGPVQWGPTWTCLNLPGGVPVLGVPGPGPCMAGAVQGWSLYCEVQCITCNGHKGIHPKSRGQTDTNENINFVQLCWWTVIKVKRWKPQKIVWSRKLQLCLMCKPWGGTWLFPKWFRYRVATFQPR